MNQSSKVYAQQKCAWCTGSGRWTLAPGNTISCIVCGGKSQVSVAQPAIQCRQCAGAGKGSSRMNPCLTCAGTGWEHVKEGNDIALS